MITQDPSLPFYMMEGVKRYNSDKCPADKSEAIAGFEEAARKTEKKIADYKKDGADTSELEFHLKALKNKLESLKK
jgi:hypothetical protein